MLLSLAATSWSVAPVEPPAAQLPELPALLEVMTRVAGLYADAALDFTCEELIVETGPGRHARYTVGGVPPRYQRWGERDRQTYRFDYFYVFNEEASAGPPGFQDYRTHRTDGAASGEPVRLEPSDLGLPAYLSRAYSWIFLFQPALRGNLAFRLEPDEHIDGRPVRVLRFEPVAGADPSTPRWSGRIWIDRERYQLLRVEAVESGFSQAALKTPGEAAPQVLFTRAEVEFGLEKNGLRFPTEVTVDAIVVQLELPLAASHREHTERLLARGVSALDRVFRIEQRYRNYRFFGVRAFEEVEARIRGEHR